MGRRGPRGRRGGNGVVEFIFNDEAFKFETLRAAEFAGDAGADVGADVGAVIATTSQIAEGDEQGWTNAWRATADRTAESRISPGLNRGDVSVTRCGFGSATPWIAC